MAILMAMGSITTRRRSYKGSGLARLPLHHSMALVVGKPGYLGHHRASLAHQPVVHGRRPYRKRLPYDCTYSRYACPFLRARNPANTPLAPWELYCDSRRPAHPLPRPNDAKSRLIRLAQTELHTHEHLYLALSPLFQRSTLCAIAGADPMSWFSTTLFVLATGTRPWAHLLERMHELHTTRCTTRAPSPHSARRAS